MKKQNKKSVSYTYGMRYKYPRMSHTIDEKKVFVVFLNDTNSDDELVI